MNAATLILGFAATIFGVLILTRRTSEQFGHDYIKWMEPPSPASAPPDKDDDPKVTVRRMAHGDAGNPSRGNGADPCQVTRCD